MVDVADHARRAHATLSPSGSAIWLNCPGSVEAQEGLPGRTSAHAEEGTAAHQLAERCGEAGFHADRFLGETIEVRPGVTFEVTREMVDAVDLYLETVRRDYRPGDTLAWERRYPLPFLPGSQFGTSDATRYSPATKTLSVYDFKYGQGVVVDVVENTQGLCYAGGAAFEVGGPLEWVEIVIVQPRAYHADGPVRRWRISAVEFFERIGKLREGAERALSPGAERDAGKWCRWCRAAATCSTLSAFAEAEARTIFGESPVDPDTLDAEQLGTLLAKASVIRSWIDAVEDHVFAKLTAGEAVPGWKLVEKRPRRQWIDADKAAADLRAAGLPDDEIYTKAIISPAVAEKVLSRAKRGIVKANTVSVSSGVTLAPASDSRPAATANSRTQDISAIFSPISEQE